MTLRQATLAREDDPGRTDVLSRAYGTMRIGGAAGHTTELRLVGPDLGLLRLAGARFHLEVGGSDRTPKALMIGALNSGRVRCTRRPEMCFGPGEVFLMPLPGCDGTTLVEDVDVDLALLDGGLVGELAGRDPDLDGPRG